MLKHLSLIAALATVAACGSHHDDAAERRGVDAKLSDSRTSTAEMTDGELVQHAIDVAHQAAGKFDARRAAHLERMHARLDVVELEQPMLLGLAGMLPLTDSGRTDVNAKLDHLTSSLQQATLAVDQLDAASDRDYAANIQVADQAMHFVDAARTQAWRAIGDARRVGTEDVGNGSASWSTPAGQTGSAAATPSS